MIKVIYGDITKLRDIDIVVSAANGIGVAGAGVAGAIARSMGDKAAKEVREYCKTNGPFKAGTSYRTDAGLLKRIGVKEIYHAVTMNYPGTPTSVEIVESALRSVMIEAILAGAKSIAIPGLGTGIGGLDKTQVAQRMAGILRSYRGQIEITVVDRNSDFIEQINRSLGNDINGTLNSTNSGS